VVTADGCFHHFTPDHCVNTFISLCPSRLAFVWIGFCFTGPISLCLDSLLHVLCVLLYTVCMCMFVTR